MAWNSCFYIGLRTFGIIMCSELLLLSWALNFCFYLGLGSFAITWLRTLTIILSLKLLQFAKTRTRYHVFQAQANRKNSKLLHGTWKLIVFFRAYLVTILKTLVTNLFSSQFISVDYKFWNRVIRRKSNCREKMHFLQKKK